MGDDIPTTASSISNPAASKRSRPACAACSPTIPGRSPSRARSATSSGAARSRSSIRARTIRAHIAALLDAVRGETVTHIFVTHTHRDHSPAVPAIKAATGATVLAEGPHRASRPLHAGEAPRMEASNDTDFRPDRALADGEVVSGAGWTIEAVATPGHTANHMAFALKEANLLFSGDHVMGWSTSIVAPPDGAMSDFMASLHKLALRPETVYLPGHGGEVRDAPHFVRGLYRASPRARSLDPAPARAKARPTSRPSCARSISGSIRG